jgi:hypothetical protein
MLREKVGTGTENKTRFELTWYLIFLYDCQAFENTLEAWISILHEKQIFPPGYCRQASAAIFNSYLEVNCFIFLTGGLYVSSCFVRL